MTLEDPEDPVLPDPNTPGIERLVACEVVIILRAAMGTCISLPDWGCSYCKHRIPHAYFCTIDLANGKVFEFCTPRELVFNVEKVLLCPQLGSFIVQVRCKLSTFLPLGAVILLRRLILI
jgi:hypothetical protein